MDVVIQAKVTRPIGFVSEWTLDPRVVLQRLLGLEKPTDVWPFSSSKVEIIEDDQKIKKPAVI